MFISRCIVACFHLLNGITAFLFGPENTNDSLKYYRGINELYSDAFNYRITDNEIRLVFREIVQPLYFGLD